MLKPGLEFVKGENTSVYQITSSMPECFVRKGESSVGSGLGDSGVPAAQPSGFRPPPAPVTFTRVTFIRMAGSLVSTEN